MFSKAKQDAAFNDTSSTAPTLFSDAASAAPTLMYDPNDEPRTTLTGQPIPQQQHSSLSSMTYSEGGIGVTSAAGANLLPPGYTDSSMVRVPIKTADYASPSFHDIKPEKRRSFFSKLKTGSSSEVEVKVIAMSRLEYLKYWVKGEDGKFRADVVEPPEGRAAWVRMQLEINEKWREEGILKDGPDKRVSGPGGFMAGAPAAMFSM
ncbi:hypothetical protein DOTSEDRAFT_67495 [Dothistroma septosporum NZE10]|uniref:Uncharacterized protein n=1 Tax=Dothistroma septosporum (strain NZE10 / CBS 128990) TaxID=675120 RepID=N1Q1U7_DOTSN|nr:hypothetical protein DOTSEDRAFT_67495 [Dothistroma septosporum NZE10]